MPLSKSVTSAVLSIALAATSVVPLSGTASARDWDRDGPGRGGPTIHDRGFDGHPGGRGDWRHGDSHHSWHRHNHDGRNLAIGAFATITILGLAIASEAARDHRYDDRY